MIGKMNFGLLLYFSFASEFYFLLKNCIPTIPHLASWFYFFLKKCILSILLTSSLKGVFSLHFVLLLDITSFLKGVFSLYWICYLTLLSSEKVCPVYTLLGFYSFPAEILCLRNPAADEIKKFCGIFPGFRYFIFSFSVQW